MKRSCLFLVLALVFAFQAHAYVTSCKYMPLTRGSWDFVERIPRCTLHLTLKPHGAEGYMDITFDSKINQYSYFDSLETISQLTLPRNAMADSMILWIGNLMQPACHISVAQANATYNDIVHVTRRDPAFLRLVTPNDPSQYELKVFPLFRDTARHVRIYLKFLPENLDSMNRIDLGQYTPEAVYIQMDSGLKETPKINKGQLTVTSTKAGPVYSFTNQRFVFVSWGKNTRLLAPGVAGIIDTTFPDTGYFNLDVDFQKLFNLDTTRGDRHITFVWVPSSYQYYYRYYNYTTFDSEKEILRTYLNSFKSGELINIVYAGETAEMYEPHMVPASQTVKSKACAFLDARIRPASATSKRQSFEALKMAFASIASCDTPAVVFCMDREPASGSGRQDTLAVERMVTKIVEININKARFIAWIDNSKYFFYQRLAKALNGKISVYGNWTLSQMDDEFKPAIANAQVCFNNTNADVMDMINTAWATTTNTVPYSWDYSGINPTQDRKWSWDRNFFGKTGKKNLTFVASIDVDGNREVKIFNMNVSGNSKSGSYIHKAWAKEIIGQYTSNNCNILNPTPGLVSTESYPWRDPAFYSQFTGISQRNGVLTHATALLALEPGMELSPDPMDPNTGDGMIGNTAIESDSAGRSADSTVLKLTASPNPFNPSTRITLSGIKTGKAIVLTIYDVQGKLVKQIQSLVSRGKAEFAWDGANLSGKHMGSGVYVARVSVEKRNMEMKLFLVK